MKNWLFIRFFRTAGVLGGSSVIIAIVLFGVAIVEHLRDKNIAGAWFVFFGCLAFCGGCYKAWVVEHMHAEDALAQIGGLQNAKFTVTITQVSVGESEEGGTPLMVVFATVRNQGAQSSAYIGRFDFRLSDGTEVRALSVIPPAEKITLSNNGVGYMNLWNKDLLSKKLTEEVIAHNGIAVGWLPYRAPQGITKKQIEASSHMVLTVVDMDNNPVRSHPFPTPPPPGRSYDTLEETRLKPLRDQALAYS